VDIKLAVDVVEFALLNPTVGTFVFVTGDGDFIHLINTLRTRGKRVVIIGASWNTSWQLTSSADQFIAYDIDVDPATPRGPATAKPSAPPLDEAFKALAEVVKYVREKHRPNVFAQVKLLLASRLGSFDEQAYGFSKFKDFMKEAEKRGLVKTQTVGLTDRVYLPDEQIETGLASDSPQEVESEAREAAGWGPGAEAAAEASQDGQDSAPPPSPAPTSRRRSSGRRAPQRVQEPDEDSFAALVRFVAMLEEGSPFMSFNYIVNRFAESRILPLPLDEISALVDRAVQDGMFLTDTRTILDRVTGEYRDINIFRLNRTHPLVARALEEEGVPVGTA